MIELNGLFNVLLVCLMKEISCSYRGNNKHYRAFGGKCLSTVENGSKNFLSYKHQDFLLFKISDPKIQKWGIESCDWSLNNVCVFGSFCLQCVWSGHTVGRLCLFACLSVWSSTNFISENAVWILKYMLLGVYAKCCQANVVLAYKHTHACAREVYLSAYCRFAPRGLLRTTCMYIAHRGNVTDTARSLLHKRTQTHGLKYWQCRDRFFNAVLHRLECR